MVGVFWQGVCIRKIFGLVEHLAIMVEGTEGRSKVADILRRTLIAQCILSTGGNYFNLNARRLLAGGWRDIAAMRRGIHSIFKTVVITDWYVRTKYCSATVR